MLPLLMSAPFLQHLITEQDMINITYPPINKPNVNIKLDSLLESYAVDGKLSVGDCVGLFVTLVGFIVGDRAVPSQLKCNFALIDNDVHNALFLELDIILI
eukprot:98369_1